MNQPQDTAAQTALRDAKSLIANLELPYLQELATYLQEHVEKRQSDKRQWARDEIARIAAGVGLDAKELVNLAPAKPAKSAKELVRAKYRDPLDPTKTWSGRGRTPLWMVDLLAKGRVAAEFEISQA